MGNVRSNPQALQTTPDHSELFVWVANAQRTNNTRQGAKANMKRERNAKDQKTAKSQTKSNEKAMSIQCQICRQTFLQTTKAPALLEHASNKHSKGLPECFPGISA
ncbi:unnamed protein product [Penicillium palitans]